MAHILILEDDVTINEMTAEFLRRKGCRCTQGFSGTEGRLLLAQQSYDLVLLDLMLPGMSGEELLGRIRPANPVPVIVLTARGALEDKLKLLCGGADDYLTKPFDLEELWARINIQLRHAGGAAAQGEVCGYRDWTLDASARRFTAKGKPVELTAHEFDIMELFMRHPQKVFTKQEIFEAVWRQDYFVEDKTINVHISNIRAKLRPSGTENNLQTVWGIGFKLAE